MSYVGGREEGWWEGITQTMCDIYSLEFIGTTHSWSQGGNGVQSYNEVECSATDWRRPLVVYYVHEGGGTSPDSEKGPLL